MDVSSDVSMVTPVGISIGAPMDISMYIPWMHLRTSMDVSMNISMLLSSINH